MCAQTLMTTASVEKEKMLRQQETQSLSGFLIGCICCQSTLTAPQHLPQTHSGSAAFTDGDSQGTCGLSAAIGEKEERKREPHLLKQRVR